MNYQNLIIVGRYKIDKELSSSAGLTTCVGEDIKENRTVYFKFYAPELITNYEVDKLCFANEYEQLKSFDDENIVKLFYAGDFDGGFCIVTDYYDAETLEYHLQNKHPFDITTTLSIVHQLACALTYAHEKNIIHKNIKPSSILLLERSDKYIAKLTEFGMSYVIDYAATTNGSVIDNFGYMSPEATGLLDRKVGIASDLYSLGVIFYQMLTGTLPFTADTIDNLIYQQVAVAPKSPSEISQDIPEALSNIVLKLLNKDPDLRYRSAAELCTDIEAFERGESRTSTNQEILNMLNSRSKYIGRGKELKRLKNYYRLAATEQGKLCLINGGPGAGKSDLIISFQNEMRSENVSILYGRFVKQASMPPYSAFQEVLDFYECIFEQYDNRTRIMERSRLVKLLGGLTEIVYRINPDMKHILLESDTLPPLDSYKEQQRTIMLLTKLFLNLFPEKTPYIICLDDIQHADAASITLLKELARELAAHKIFLLCTYRIDNADDSSLLNSLLKELKDSKVDYEEITLNPFNELQMTEYVSMLLGIRKDECKGLAAYIMDKTAGNPYFTLNIIRSLLEDGVISIRNGSLQQNWTNISDYNASPDLGDIIKKRMEKLPSEAIEFFRLASVIGNEFPTDLLLAMSHRTEDEIVPWIGQAVSMQFVEPAQHSGNYQFAHSQIHDAFFNLIKKEDLPELHKLVAQTIELLNPHPTSKDIYSLVYHYTQAGMDSEVQKYILECANYARLSNANTDAIKYYEKAIDIMKSHNEAASELCMKTKRTLTELYITVGKYEKAIMLSNELMDSRHNALEKASLMRNIGRGYFRQGYLVECEKTLVEALRLLGDRYPRGAHQLKIASIKERLIRRVKDLTTENPIDVKEIKVNEKNKILVSVYETLIWAHTLSNVPKFRYASQHILRLAQKHMGRSRELASALCGYGSCLMSLGDFKKSEDFHRASLNLRRELLDDYGVAQSLQMLGFCFQWRGENKQSIKFFNESVEMFNKIGDVWESATSQRGAAFSYYLYGDYDDAIKLSEQSIFISKKINNIFGLCSSYATLIHCYCELGKHQQAEEYAMIAFDFCSRANLPYSVCILNTCYGELLIEMGQHDRAIRYLEEAVIQCDKNVFLVGYVGQAYSLLALAKLLQYQTSTEVSREDSSEYLSGIENLCHKGLKALNKWPNQVTIAYRVTALFYAEIERYKYAEQYFVRGIEQALDSERRYELARIHYEYSIFLNNKHRAEEARYHLFEAYMNFSAVSSSGYIKECEKIITTRYQADLGDNMILANVSARRNRLNIDRKINTLLRLGELLTSTLELEELEKKILQNAVELVGAERGMLFLYPESGPKKLYVASIYNLGSLDYNTCDWMLDAVEKSGQPIVINDLQSEEYRKHYSIMVRYGIKSVMAMPMFVRGKLFGVIYLDSRLTRGIFSEEYMETLGFIANQGGAPIENARLYKKAITDGLTGIYGRSYLDNLLVDKTSVPAGVRELSALMLDVDMFKKCNDTYGHQFGDKVLKVIASTIKRLVGDLGTVCRYGGEEFVAILDTNDLTAVTDVAERIRNVIETTSVLYNDNINSTPVSVTISIGAAIWYDGMERVELIEHADKALYFAKNNGRNKVCVYCAEMDAEDFSNEQ